MERVDHEGCSAPEVQSSNSLNADAMQMLSEVLSEDCAITLDVHKIRQKHFGMEILQG